jgi:L-threonylcarbamoyladenylate synthase
MKIVPDDAEGLLQAINVLKSGGVVAHATDTCFGLAADIFNESAVNKIAKIKGTQTQRPISIIVADFDDVLKMADITTAKLMQMKQYLPGPYTVIVPKKLECEYQKFERNIGIRIPKHDLSVHLVRELERPITTTSANIHGQPPAYSAEEVYKAFKNAEFKPDLIIDSKKLQKNSPSRIVNLCGDEAVWLR